MLIEPQAQILVFLPFLASSPRVLYGAPRWPVLTATLTSCKTPLSSPAHALLKPLMYPFLTQVQNSLLYSSQATGSRAWRLKMSVKSPPLYIRNLAILFVENVLFNRVRSILRTGQIPHSFTPRCYYLPAHNSSRGAWP